MRRQGSAAALEVRRRIAGQMLLDGRGVNEVARLLKVSPSSVSRWKRAVESEGLEGLAPRPHPGPAPRLSDGQKGELREILVAGAVAFGFASDGRTGPRVAHVVAERFAVEYHVDHAWKLLRSLGFTSQRRNRLSTASHDPNSTGRSHRGTPVRARYSSAPRNIRSGSSVSCPPRCRLEAFTAGSRVAQLSSVSMHRMPSEASFARHS